MTDTGWLAGRADQIRGWLHEAKTRRKAAERACDAAGLIEADPIFERACKAYDGANEDVMRLQDELYAVEREIADQQPRRQPGGRICAVKDSARNPPGIKVQRRRCKTCIYRKDWRGTPIADLEAMVADPKMEDFFAGYRECHHAKRGSGVCCRGFWDHHKDEFNLGQLAQRLNMVVFVDEDTLK